MHMYKVVNKGRQREPAFPSLKLILSGKSMLQSLHKVYSFFCVIYVMWNQGPYDFSQVNLPMCRSYLKTSTNDRTVMCEVKTSWDKCSYGNQTHTT